MIVRLVALLSGFLFLLGVASSAAAEGQEEQLMTLPEARQYMLGLINKDRATEGLRPVKLDPVATKAGQNHADEMAQNLYMAHWDVLGKKPWERYNDVGGTVFVAENVAFVGTTMDGQPAPQALPLVSPPMFPRKGLREMEEAMFSEKAPNDGHRRNILDKHHTGVGIGMSVAMSGGWSRITLDQEFTANHGSFSHLPKVLPRGKEMTIDGTLDSDLAISNVLLEWEKTPHSMMPAQLNATHSYDWPDVTLLSCFPPPYRTDARVQVTPLAGREKFSVTLPPIPKPEPGVYYAVVWAHKKSDPKDVFVASVRTMSCGTRATMPILASAKLPTVKPAETTTSATSSTEPSATASAGPDIRTLFFHPESFGSKVTPVTIDRTGPPDVSQLFFKPALPDKQSEETKPPDMSKLFFDPSRVNKPNGTDSNKPDVRKLFFHP